MGPRYVNLFVGFIIIEEQISEQYNCPNPNGLDATLMIVLVPHPAANLTGKLSFLMLTLFGLHLILLKPPRDK